MSTARLVILRQAVYDAIEVARDTLIVNDFNLVQTYYPWTKLEDVQHAAKVTVIGLASDSESISRTNAYRSEYPIQVAIQKVVDPTDTEAIDRYVLFVEQLKQVLRDLNHDEFSYLRDETLKDENDVPYSFMGLREASTFEAFFSTYYMTTGP